jgi:hypothetical protein
MKVTDTQNPSEKKTAQYELDNIYKLTTRQQDYINPMEDGNLSWRSNNACSSYLEEELEN